MADRGHLQAALDGVLDLIGDAGAAATLSGARYTENGQELPIGQGLWATAANDASKAGRP